MQHCGWQIPSTGIPMTKPTALSSSPLVLLSSICSITPWRRECCSWPVVQSFTRCIMHTTTCIIMTTMVTITTMTIMTIISTLSPWKTWVASLRRCRLLQQRCWLVLPPSWGCPSLVDSGRRKASSQTHGVLLSKTHASSYPLPVSLSVLP